MVMTSVIMASVVVRGPWRIGIAQHYFQLAIDWRQHKARRNEGAKAQHRKNERRGPAMDRTGRKTFRSDLHAAFIIPDNAASATSGWALACSCNCSDTLALII
jgi:hypothetical protein